MFYYCDWDGVEVDFILEIVDGFIVVIEIKLVVIFCGRDICLISRFCDKVGVCFVGGVILYIGL